MKTESVLETIIIISSTLPVFSVQHWGPWKGWDTLLVKEILLFETNLKVKKSV